MLPFNNGKGARMDAKVYATVGTYSAHVDAKSTPTKKKPFSCILNQSFTSSVDLIMPAELYDAIWEKVLKNMVQGMEMKWARVFMQLGDLLSGRFFEEYIKTGNITMLSSGRRGVDNCFSLRDGILRLDIDKESYERAGLVGKPIRSGGRKHVKARYLVEINLRLPSMLHGKKGFERIVWAFKNVLNHSVEWLFCDLQSATGEATGLSDAAPPLAAHHPIRRNCIPAARLVKRVHTPDMAVALAETGEANESEFRDYCNNISEWLSLVSLGSARVLADDRIDSYLSRYEVPRTREELEVVDLVVVKWMGFIPANWITQLLVSCLRESRSATQTSSSWFALTASAMGKEAVEGKDGYTILTLPKSQPVAVAALGQEDHAVGSGTAPSSSGDSLDPEQPHRHRGPGPARYVSMEFECNSDGRA